MSSDANVSQVDGLTFLKEYTAWRYQFMRQRLELVLLIAIASLFTFAILDIVHYNRTIELNLYYLFINFSQQGVLILSLLLLYLPLGKRYPEIVFLLLSWSVTLVPQLQGLSKGVAYFDLISWTLTFVGQATLLPICWQLHLLSQLVAFLCFFAVQAIFHSSVVGIGSHMLSTYYLYLFWFCVICNVSVYLYECLKRAEILARLELQFSNLALTTEREKSERLLLNILPAPVSERLKQNQETIADGFTAVSVLFADIVGFTHLSTQLTAIRLVRLLNEIFSDFDRLVERHGLEKIKTIGDAYMVVAGLPEPCPQHATKMADLALDMQRAVTEFNRRCEQNLSIRIGIHTGPVVAGVIGIKKFAYDLWGDTVNTASRMESHGIADAIQVSAEMYELLKEKYTLTKRGEIFVKGKGDMTTYWLEGKLSS